MRSERHPAQQRARREREASLTAIIMISLKRLSGRRGEQYHDGKADASAPQKPARDSWGVMVEPMTVSGEAVYAISFHRKGTSIYYLHRHYRDRQDAEKEFARLTNDLILSETEFETKYALDALS
jgi:hypothetical protein